jgi:2-polyprenyl-6-hydroxyphenyl methylase/3-demethylubiquinone-9 3-methyltransferase
MGGSERGHDHHQDHPGTHPDVVGDYGGLTDSGYWDASWARVELPRLISFDHHVNRRWDSLFGRVLADRAGSSVVEVGCAPGAWLIYFHRRWGLIPTGIESSPVGAALTRQNAELTGTDLRVIEADMFDPSINEQFDVVWSGGLVEHFVDLDDPVARLRQFVAPGGLVITSVPNLNGSMYFWLRRLLNPTVLRAHRVVTPAGLATAYAANGLAIEFVGYHGTWNLEVVNFGRHSRLQRWANRVDRLFGKVLGATRARGESRWLSPYVVAVGRAPGAGGASLSATTDDR